MKETGERLNKLVTSRGLIQERIEKTNLDLNKLDQSLVSHVEAREIIQKAAQLTQESLEERLTEIVSQALDLVFDNLNLGFKVEFLPRRNSTECDMFITEDGELYDPLSSCGFGAADVASFALRVAMWTLNKTDNIMVFDEPFRNLGDDDMPQAALLLSTLSEELGIQMVIVTHKEELKNNAGLTYRVTKRNKISTVELEKTP